MSLFEGVRKWILGSRKQDDDDFTDDDTDDNFEMIMQVLADVSEEVKDKVQVMIDSDSTPEEVVEYLQSDEIPENLRDKIDKEVLPLILSGVEEGGVGDGSDGDGVSNVEEEVGEGDLEEDFDFKIYDGPALGL